MGGQAAPPTELCRRTGNCIRRIVLCVSPESQTCCGVVVKIVVKPRSGENGKFMEFPETPRTGRAPGIPPRLAHLAIANVSGGGLWVKGVGLLEIGWRVQVVDLPGLAG